MRVCVCQHDDGAMGKDCRSYVTGTYSVYSIVSRSRSRVYNTKKQYISSRGDGGGRPAFNDAIYRFIIIIEYFYLLPFENGREPENTLHVTLLRGVRFRPLPFTIIVYI